MKLENRAVSCETLDKTKCVLDPNCAWCEGGFDCVASFGKPVSEICPKKDNCNSGTNDCYTGRRGTTGELIFDTSPDCKGLDCLGFFECDSDCQKAIANVVKIDGNNIFINKNRIDIPQQSFNNNNNTDSITGIIDDSSFNNMNITLNGTEYNTNFTNFDNDTVPVETPKVDYTPIESIENVEQVNPENIVNTSANENVIRSSPTNSNKFNNRNINDYRVFIPVCSHFLCRIINGCCFYKQKTSENQFSAEDSKSFIATDPDCSYRSRSNSNPESINRSNRELLTRSVVSHDYNSSVGTLKNGNNTLLDYSLIKLDNNNHI